MKPKRQGGWGLGKPFIQSKKKRKDQGSGGKRDVTLQRFETPASKTLDRGSANHIPFPVIKLEPGTYNGVCGTGLIGFNEKGT